MLLAALVVSVRPVDLRQADRLMVAEPSLDVAVEHLGRFAHRALDQHLADFLLKRLFLLFWQEIHWLWRVYVWQVQAVLVFERGLLGLLLSGIRSLWRCQSIYDPVALSSGFLHSHSLMIALPQIIA